MDQQDFSEKYAGSPSACFVLAREEGIIRVLYANEKGLEMAQVRVIPSPVTVCLSAMPAHFFFRLEDAMTESGVDGWNLFQGEAHTELSFCLVPLENGSGCSPSAGTTWPRKPCGRCWIPPAGSSRPPSPGRRKPTPPKAASCPI